MDQNKRRILENQKNILRQTTPDAPRYDFQEVRRVDHSSLINLMQTGQRHKKERGIAVTAKPNRNEFFAPGFEARGVTDQRHRAQIKYGQYEGPGAVYYTNDFRANEVELTNKLKDNREFIFGRFRNNAPTVDLKFSPTTMLQPTNGRQENPNLGSLYEPHELRQMTSNLLFSNDQRTDFVYHGDIGDRPHQRGHAKLGAQNGKFKPLSSKESNGERNRTGPGFVIDPMQIRQLSHRPGTRVVDIIENIGFVWKAEVVESLKKMEHRDYTDHNKKGSTVKHISNIILCNKAVDDSNKGLISLAKSPFLTQQQRSMVDMWVRNGYSERQICASITKINLGVMKDLYNPEFSNPNGLGLPTIDNLIHKNVRTVINIDGLPNFYNAINPLESVDSRINPYHGQSFTQFSHTRDGVFIPPSEQGHFMGRQPANNGLKMGHDFEARNWTSLNSLRTDRLDNELGPIQQGFKNVVNVNRMNFRSGFVIDLPGTVGGPGLRNLTNYSNHRAGNW